MDDLHHDLYDIEAKDESELALNVLFRTMRWWAFLIR